MYNKLSIAKQYINEKIDSTKREIVYEDDFLQLKKKFEAMAKFFESFPGKINEIVHPNKQWRLTHKLHDQFGKLTKIQPDKEEKYPQVEKSISIISLQCGSQVGGLYGQSLIDISSGFDQISDIKDKLELEVKSFIIRNQDMDNEILNISSCKKKLSSKRLKLEALKNKKSAGNSAELYKTAEEYNSLNLECYNAYLTFVEIEQDKKIEQMLLLAQSFEHFYSDCLDTMKGVVEMLQKRHKTSLTTGKPNLKNPEASDVGNKIMSIIEVRHSSKDQTSLKSKNIEEPHIQTNISVINEVPTSQEYSNSNNTRKIEKSSSNQKLKEIISKPSNDFNHINIRDSFENDDLTYDLPQPRANAEKPTKLAAIFNFKAENEEELDFKIGDVITYISDLDESWYFGEFNHKKGIFPKDFVKRIS